MKKYGNTMSKINAKFLLAIFTLFVTASAHAVVFLSATYAAPPEAGQYWNPQEPGNGYGIDIDRNGAVFVQWFTYRVDGVPVWYTMSGTIERAGPQKIGSSGTFNGVIPSCIGVPFSDRCLGDKIRFLKTGVLARVTSPVYAVVNGACPTCPPRFPDVSQSPLGPATIEWVGSRAAVLTFQGRSVSIQRQDIATPASALVANIDFKGVSADLAGGPGIPTAVSFLPFTARFSRDTRITNVSSDNFNGVPLFDLSALNLNVATTPLFLGNVVFAPPNGFLGTINTNVIAIDEKNNRAYLLKGRMQQAADFIGTDFKVSEYGELFIYGDRLISWLQRRQFNQELGIPHSTEEWKFERPLRASDSIVRD